MKKIAILIIFSLFATEFVAAQQREINRANRHLNRGNLERAWNHITTAINDASTADNPEAWVTKTRILMEISIAEEPEIRELAEQPLEKAYEAIQKAQELDVENLNILDIQQTLLVLSEFLFNEGAEAFNENQYAIASMFFRRSFTISESFGAIDTSTIYNAGLAAEIAGMLDEAYEHYIKVAELDYDQPFLYSSLSNISLRKEDFENAEKWIKMGRERYPDNLDLIFTEANVYLTTGNIPEARRVLELAIEKDPENANLHYAFAVNFDQMSKDTLYTSEERQFAYKEATKAYQKAIEIEPDYFDAIYNLGALYFNEGIQFFIQADNILREGYTTENLQRASELEEKSKEIWSENAQPYLERALELIEEDDDNYEIVLRSLRELYMRTGQNEKLEATNAIWNERFGSDEEEE